MRICVKGLPKTTDEAQLRTHFATLGEPITDVKIARTRAGASRQFAFIGFKTAEASAAAVRRFNRSFLGACRLAVEAAAEIDDETRIKLAWSRHTKQKVAAKAAAAVAPPKATGESRRESKAPADSERLREYVSLAAAGSKGRSWANDDALARSVQPVKALKQSGPADDSDGGSTDSGEYMDAPAVSAAAAVGGGGWPAAPRPKPLGQARQRGGADTPAGASTAGVAAGESAGRGAVPSDGAGASAAASRAAPLSDADFLRAHTVAGAFDDDDDDDVGDEEDESSSEVSSVVSSDSDDDEAGTGEKGGGAGSKAAGLRLRPPEAMPAAPGGSGDDAGAEEEEDEEEAEGDGPAAAASGAEGEGEESGGEGGEGVGETGRLFVRNLPYSTTDEELQARGVAGRRRKGGLRTPVLSTPALAPAGPLFALGPDR